jgi:Tol biopolymer transport system component
LSPDGKHLAYTAGNCASWQNVWLTVVDGRAHATDFRGRLRLPSDAVIWAHPLAFEPRSGAFLVDVSSYNGECRGPYHRAEELFLVAAAGGAVTRVADISSYMFFSLECCAAALSPDGRMLAYYAQDNYGYWIRIVSIASGNTREIKLRVPGWDVGALDLVWSPNSRRLVYSEPGNVRLYNLSSGSVRTLNKVRLQRPMLAGFSRNGSVFAYSGLPYRYVQLISLATGARKRAELPRRPGLGAVGGIWSVLE